jgi:hypothetical protein
VLLRHALYNVRTFYDNIFFRLFYNLQRQDACHTHIKVSYCIYLTFSAPFLRCLQRYFYINLLNNIKRSIGEYNMALESPGVQVSVIDESFYTPAEPGTTPLIIVASGQDKTNSSGTGVAPGTLASNAGKVYTITSQRDLAETFGDPIFYTDASGAAIHGGEQNEYGLQAAYSFLGVANRAYIVRADLDLAELTATSEAPAGDPEAGTYWLDTEATSFGMFEWNGNAATTSGGQKFKQINPIIITDENQVDGASPYSPLSSIGAIGDYAVVAISAYPIKRFWYKTKTNLWVEVGSNAWSMDWPTVTGTKSNVTVASGETLTITGTNLALTVTVPGSGQQSLSTLAAEINTEALGAGKQNYISAGVVNGKLEIYVSNALDGSDTETTTSNGITLGGTLATAVASDSDIGVALGTYYPPRLQISAHTSVPEFKTIEGHPRPSGSIWVKTTDPNGGARWRLNLWNTATKLWDSVSAPLYASNQAAIYNLDRAAGGANIGVGTIYVQTNAGETAGADADPALANFKIFRREVLGPVSITSSPITAGTFVSGTTYTYKISESRANEVDLTVGLGSFTGAGDASLNAIAFATSVNAMGLVNVTAAVDANNRVVITHGLGGEFRISNDTGIPFTEAGFSAYQGSGVGTPNLYGAPAGDAAHDFVASGWKFLAPTCSADNPTSLTADGALWYNSIVDEVDLMIHDGQNWRGYQNVFGGFTGPMVTATQPTTKADGSSPLEFGDIWIDTSNLEEYPQIYRYSLAGSWELLDSTDQTSEDGVLFADARWGTSGGTSAGIQEATIDDLLINDFLDPDAPDPALYPKGMILWNTRRSGFNVKKFVRNYIDTTADNERQNGVGMSNYYPHRWVTVSTNNEDGSGAFGRHAQRKVVIKALQALVNSNEDIRDEETLNFNLIACPGYSELIGEMVTLNYDRGLTGFVVGDTPFRLQSNGTALNNWGKNVALAVEDNDDGLVTSDEYLGIYYPSGFTSDNFGNNVVVPPSHMMLRTIALSDQVSYPWFAPAGTRRGGITNASAVGYVDGEGEFRSIALNEGQRDILYSVNTNPITFITGSGVVCMGQKTRARNASALDRINVARLVVYLRRQLNALAKPYIFEPNDKITRDEIKQQVESLMLELVGQRALYDFLVVCDESNNTPARIDRNQLYVDIAIEPVKSVEFIYIPLRLKNTGEIASLG